MIAVGVLASGIVLGATNAVLRETMLPRMMSGDTIATLAWQGGPTRSDGIAPIGPTAVIDGTGYRIDGQAVFVPAAITADVLIVAAAAPEGLLLAWVPRDAPGVTLRTIPRADYAPLATIGLDGVSVAPDQIIVVPPAGQAVLDAVLDRARTAICAEAVGVMHRTVELSVEYMVVREQFGRPIGSFQALQHRAVDLYTLLELARSATMRAAAAIDQGRRDSALLVAAAKARCGEAGPRIAGQAIHLHGTIGFTEDLDLSLYIRRAHALASWLGNGEASLSRYIALAEAAGP